MAELTDERAWFEDRINRMGYDIIRDERNGGRDYARPATRAAWDGYRLALSATGAEDAKALEPLTERELVQCIAAAGCFGTIKISYDSGPYEITRPSMNASRLAEQIASAIAAKNGLSIRTQSNGAAGGGGR